MSLTWLVPPRVSFRVFFARIARENRESGCRCAQKFEVDVERWRITSKHMVWCPAHPSYERRRTG